jgi:hypothetical protein
MTSSLEVLHTGILDKFNIAHKVIDKMCEFINYKNSYVEENLLYSCDDEYMMLMNMPLEVLSSHKNKTYDKKIKNNKYKKPVEVKESKLDNIILSINKVKSCLASIVDDYKISTIQPLSDFYKNIPGNNESFNDALIIYDIDGRFNECISDIKIILKKIKKDNVVANFDDNVYDLMTKDISFLLNNKIDITSKSINYEYCCGVKKTILADKSELYCELCNTTMPIVGMVFNDAQFYCQDTRKTKHGKYDVLRNFSTWLDHIYATDGFIISEDMRSYLDHFLKREQLGEFGSSREVTIVHVRAFLEEYRYSKFNKHGSAILAQISGIYPPQRSEKDNTILINIFNRIVMILHNSKDPIFSDVPNNQNVPFSPYWVSKIIQTLWPDDLEKQRIQAYIFHKKPETVKELDNKWFKMCPLLGFKFIPTNITSPPIKPYYDMIKVQNAKNNSSTIFLQDNYITFHT